MELLNTQTGELSQTHIDDSLRLELIEIEASLQVTLGISRSLRVADDTNHLVDIVHGDDQTFEDVGTLLGFLQVVLCTTDRHIVAMLNEVLDTLLECKQTRTTLYQSNVIH